MPKPGFTVITIKQEVDYKLEKLMKKTKAKSKQEVISALVDGALK